MHVYSMPCVIVSVGTYVCKIYSYCTHSKTPVSLPDPDEYFTEYYYTIRYVSEDGTVETATQYSYDVYPGQDLTYTLRFLTRDTEYNVQIRMQVSHYYCYFGFGDLFNSGNYSDFVSFRTNATSKLMYALWLGILS